MHIFYCASVEICSVLTDFFGRMQVHLHEWSAKGTYVQILMIVATKAADGENQLLWVNSLLSWASQTTSFSILSIFNDRYSINYYMHTITTACLSSYQSQRIMHPQHVHFNNNTFKTSSFVMHNLKKGIVEQLAELLSLSTRDPGSNLLRCCLCWVCDV